MIYKIKFKSISQIEELLNEAQHLPYTIILRNENGLSLPVINISDVIYMINFDTLYCHIDFSYNSTKAELDVFHNLLNNIGLLD